MHKSLKAGIKVTAALTAAFGASALGGCQTTGGGDRPNGFNGQTPSPFTGRIISQDGYGEYCDNVGGRPMWVIGYSQTTIIGADNQVHIIPDPRPIYQPARPTWSCGTFGQLLNGEREINKINPFRAPYNGLPTSGPRNF
jgi:hypothetical protein